MEDISHQIKTPLTSISIMLDSIIENKEMDELTKNKFLHEIRRQLDWINWLVISLLKLSKLDSNTIEFNPKEFYVEELIKQLLQNLSVPLEIKGQEVIVEGQEDTKLIADFNWQLEAISNILKNCIEHTDEGKKIYISYSENNFYTSIIIKDEGKGIAKEELKLRAVASITIDECFVIHDIKVIDGKDGLFISMPSRKTPDGEFKDIVHPLNTETREEIRDLILAEYEKALKEVPAEE